MQPAGLSATRLTALTNAMQGYVERGEVAGVVSMVWRRGEIGYFEPLGLARRSRRSCRWSATRCFASRR